MPEMALLASHPMLAERAMFMAGTRLRARDSATMQPVVKTSALLLRLVLAVSFLVNGAWSAFASTYMQDAGHGAAMAQAAAHAVHASHMQHVAANHAAMADAGHAIPDPDHGDHAVADDCASAACQCACMHGCAGTLPATVCVSLQPMPGLHVAALVNGHPAPMLPYPIRPPIA